MTDKSTSIPTPTPPFAVGQLVFYRNFATLSVQSARVQRCDLWSTDRMDDPRSWLVWLVGYDAAIPAIHVYAERLPALESMRHRLSQARTALTHEATHERSIAARRDRQDGRAA